MKFFKRHWNSYRYAINGIWIAFRREPNMRIHLVAGLLVFLTNFLLEVKSSEWLITLLLVGLVWMAEIFNTALERLADRVSLEEDPLIGQAKDLAAGAVLVLCIVAVISGLLIYIPYLVS